MSHISYNVDIRSIIYTKLCTRPDVAFAISLLTRFMSNPTFQHWNGFKYLIRYLKHTTSYGLCFKNHLEKMKLLSCYDSFYAGCKG